jgi:hypothetical protein
MDLSCIDFRVDLIHRPYTANLIIIVTYFIALPVQQIAFQLIIVNSNLNDGTLSQKGM